MIDVTRLPQDDSPETVRENLIEIAGDDNLLFLDGFDHCILGLCSIHGTVPRVAYSVELIIESLQKEQGMTYDEATEYFDFNIGGANVGPYTPAMVIAAPNVEVTNDE